MGVTGGLGAARQLDQALQRLAQELEQKAGVVTVVEIDPEAAGTLADVAPDIVQLAREALSSEGTRVRVQLTRP